MYSVNWKIRALITSILIVITFLINNYYLFWLLLFYLLLISIVDRNIKSLLLNFLIVLILLFCFYTSKIRLLLKIICIINILVLFFCSFTKNERNFIKFKILYKYRKSSRKKLFYKYNSDRVISFNKEKALKLYNENDNVDNKIKRDMNFLYLCGRIRFYGYSNKLGNYMNRKVGIYDFIFLIVFIFFIILCIYFW